MAQFNGMLLAIFLFNICDTYYESIIYFKIRQSEYECVEVVNNKCTTYVLKDEK